MQRFSLRLTSLGLSLISLQFCLGCFGLQTTSPKGIQRCKDALSQLPSNLDAKARHKEYQQCLKIIDTQIAQEKQKTEHELSTEDNKDTAKPDDSSNDEQLSREAFKFCSSYSKDIAKIMEEHNKLSALVAQLDYKGEGNSDSTKQLKGQLSRVDLNLETLIPIQLRFGKPLIPDAALLHLRCSQEELQSITR